MSEEQTYIPDWQRLGFTNKKEWAEAYAENTDWEEIDQVLFHIECGDSESAQKIINNAKHLREVMQSGAAGTTLIKLKTLHLINDDSHIPKLGPELLREARKEVDERLGRFKEEDNYNEWRVVGSIITNMSNSPEDAKKQITLYRNKWDEGYSRSGSILTKLQAVGVISSIRDSEIKGLDAQKREAIENSINSFLNHQSDRVVIPSQTS